MNIIKKLKHTILRMSCNTMAQKVCPICTKSMPVSERYPTSICNAHYAECRDSEGNPVTYENEDFSGGFVSYHYINNTIVRRNDGTCFIRGQRCFAGEARMGGIVIQLITK